MDVLVIGGGVAGLSSATALALRGHRVEVVEQQAEWPAVGWGLTLTGPALRVLGRIGLDEACIAAGYPIDSISNCDVSGNEFHRVEPPSLLGPGRPVMVGIGRPALSEVLREAAAAAGVTLTLDAQVTELDQADDRVTVRIGEDARRTPDLVVAADGVGSRARAALGIPDHPEFLGQRVWRTTVDRPEWATRLHTFNSPNHSSGLIPISQEHAYVFTTEITSDAGPVAREDLPGDMRRVLAPLEGDMARIRDGISDPDRVVQRPVLGLLVEGPWHQGRLIAIGDAVHTCAPHMVSGAALAVEDAVLLAEELAAGDDLDETLTRFGERRVPRARLVVEASKQMVELEFEHRYAEEHEVQGAAFAALAQEV